MEEKTFNFEAIKESMKKTNAFLEALKNSELSNFQKYIIIWLYTHFILGIGYFKSYDISKRIVKIQYQKIKS